MVWSGAMDAETLYFQLRQLVATTPKFDNTNAVAAEDRLWLGRAAVLIPLAIPTGVDALKFSSACDSIGNGSEVMHPLHVATLLSVLNRALAQAEMAAPAAAQGQFVGAGDAFSALAAVAKVFNRAKGDLL